MRTDLQSKNIHINVKYSEREIYFEYNAILLKIEDAIAAFEVGDEKSKHDIDVNDLKSLKQVKEEQNKILNNKLDTKVTQIKRAVDEH